MTTIRNLTKSRMMQTQLSITTWADMTITLYSFHEAV